MRIADLKLLFLPSSRALQIKSSDNKSYSTYLGGNSQDIGFGIAVDAFGNAYVMGVTSSPNFPTTSGAFQTTVPALTSS